MYFYKYVVPERVDVLINGMIRFTQPTALNDPFELRPYFDTLISEEQIWSMIGKGPLNIAPLLVEIYEKQSPEIKSQIALHDFLELMRGLYATAEGKQAVAEGFAMVPESFRVVAPSVQETITASLAQHIGILSLSSDFSCAPMWAHYAANHEGMVIGFDGDHPFFHRRRGPDDEFWYLREVVYEPPASGRALIDLEGRDVLVRKNPSWSYEQEWRMLAPLRSATRMIDTGGEPIHLFEFPGGCVAEIILGARSSAEFRDRVVRLIEQDARYSHVSLMSARLDPVNPRVVAAPL